MSNVLVFSSLWNLLRRSWEALPLDRRAERVLDILSAPIVGIDGFQAQFENRRPDPGNLLRGDSEPLLPERANGNEERWQAVVKLLILSLGAVGAARGRAARRLLPVTSRNLLTKEELSQIGKALWAKEHTSDEGLPENTDLYDWTFLVLPEPKLGLADKRFRLKWLSVDPAKLQHSASSAGGITTVSFPYEPADPARLEDTLCNVGNAFSISRDRGGAFGLSSQERKHILDLVSLWAKADVPSYSFQLMQGMARKPTFLALEGLVLILAEAEVPESVGEDLFGKLKKLTESGIPGFGLIHGLVKTIPDRFDELQTWLRMGLVSDDAALVASAMSGLRSWLKASVDTGASLRRPPDDLLREIGLMISSRRSVALPQALQLARWVFDEGTSAHRERMLPLVLQGLSYLAEELKYDRERDPEGIADMPLLRWLCVQLAQSMAKGGFRDEPAVELWLNLGKGDPLPEIRYAVPPSAFPEK